MAASRRKKLKPAAFREIELKLLLDPATLSRIRRAGVLSRLPGVVPQTRGTTRNLTAIYWDTKDNQLAKAGMTLRVRRDGVSVKQGLKAADGAGGLAADRAEDEIQVPASCALDPPRLELIQDPHLRDRARAAIDGAELVPVFESAVSRVARVYEGADGGQFEAALDLGELRPADLRNGKVEVGAGEPVCEIELEHRTGPVTGLFAAARAVAERYPVRVGIASKAARGYALAQAAREGRPVADPEVVLAGKSPVLPGMAIAQAYGVLLSHGVSQIAANQEVVLLARAPEGVHQMRVAIRRFRAVYSAFHKAIPVAGADLVIPDMKNVFRVLGMARDMDVFCTETLPGMMQHTAKSAPPLGPLAAAAHEARLESWRDVTATIGAPEFTRLLLAAGYRAARAQAEKQPVGPGKKRHKSGHTGTGARQPDLVDFAIARLTLRMKQVKRKARGLAGLDDEARHDLRKRLKALRYEVDFFAPLWPREDVKAFLRPLKELQDHFGAINDAATAARVAQLAADRIGGETANRAAGYVGGWHAAHADLAFLKVQENWENFAALPHFWRQRTSGHAG